MRFIKITTQSGKYMYFNVSRIDAVNTEKNIVYIAGDVFFVTDESIKEIINQIDEEGR